MVLLARYARGVSIALFLSLQLPRLASSAGSFTDDEGVTSTWTSDKPTIACGAMDALSFQALGMSADQIVGTFAERSSSGSNYGGIYADGNLIDHGDHANAPYDPSFFPADPTEAESNFLNRITDLSPSCSASNFYCDEVNMEILNEKGWPDVLVVGSFYSSLLTESLRGNATARGVPIVSLVTAYGSSPDDPVLPRGMIEVTQRMQELATALGAAKPALIEADQKKLCSSAAAFTQIAKGAQQRGVRAMAGFLPYTTTGEKGEIGAFLSSPERDTALAMLEELGMAILHNDAEPDAAYEYQVTPNFDLGLMPYENIMSSGALGDPVPYYVDFWLYDDRVTLDFVSDSFAQAWPHKAVVAKQYAYHPSNARVYSYLHAAEILDIVGAALATADKLFDEETTCTPAPVGGWNGEAHRSKGLLPGQYACFEPVTYSFCESTESSASSSRATQTLAQWFSFLVFIVLFMV